MLLLLSLKPNLIYMQYVYWFILNIDAGFFISLYLLWFLDQFCQLRFWTFYVNICVILFHRRPVLFSSLTSSRIQRNIRLKIVVDSVSSCLSPDLILNYSDYLSCIITFDTVSYNIIIFVIIIGILLMLSNACLKSINIICKSVLCWNQFSMACLRQKVWCTADLPDSNRIDIPEGPHIFYQYYVYYPHKYFVFHVEKENPSIFANCFFAYEAKLY